MAQSKVVVESEVAAMVQRGLEHKTAAVVALLELSRLTDLLVTGGQLPVSYHRITANFVSAVEILTGVDEDAQKAVEYGLTHYSDEGNLD